MLSSHLSLYWRWACLSKMSTRISLWNIHSSMSPGNRSENLWLYNLGERYLWRTCYLFCGLRRVNISIRASSCTHCFWVLSTAPLYTFSLLEYFPTVLISRMVGLAVGSLSVRPCRGQLLYVWWSHFYTNEPLYFVIRNSHSHTLCTYILPLPFPLDRNHQIISWW